MAGDWIKMDVTTPDKPEVYAIAEALGISREEVVGRLFLVWRWFDQQSRDGDACVTLEALQNVAGLQRFAHEMVKVGWLSTGENGVKMTNFERHSSKSAKKRALAQRRMKRLRDADVTQESEPEKRREEITTTPKPPVDSFIGRSKPRSNGTSIAWWETTEATFEKAKELGLSTRGESWQALKAAIRQKLGQAAPRQFKDND